jgi:hypothetical protein
MLKRYISIFFLVVSYTIILGHSIIPHHHHDKDDFLINHHHEGEDESNNLSHLFSHFQHQTDEVVFTQLQKVDYSSHKVKLYVVEVFAVNFNFRELVFPSILYEKRTYNQTYNSPFFLPSCLRAPPIV